MAEAYLETSLGFPLPVIPHLIFFIAKVRTACTLTVFHWEYLAVTHLGFLLPTKRIKGGNHKNITVFLFGHEKNKTFSSLCLSTTFPFSNSELLKHSFVCYKI